VIVGQEQRLRILRHGRRRPCDLQRRVKRQRERDVVRFWKVVTIWFYVAINRAIDCQTLQVCSLLLKNYRFNTCIPWAAALRGYATHY
jgi:hypothetical protein